MGRNLVSDQVTCERCHLPGRRLRGHVAPEGWYFASVTLNPEGDHDPGDLLIVHACSEACRDALWTKMAGHRWDTIEQRVDVPAELRRVSDLHIARLHAEAQRITDGTYVGGHNPETHAGAAYARILLRVCAAIEQATETEISLLHTAHEPQKEPCPHDEDP